MPICTRTDAIAAGDAFPTIFVSVNIDNNAQGVLVNSATIAVAGQVDTDPTNNVASDPTVVVVNRPVPTLSVLSLGFVILLMLLAGWLVLRGRRS